MEGQPCLWGRDTKHIREAKDEELLMQWTREMFPTEGAICVAWEVVMSEGQGSQAVSLPLKP